MAFIWSTCSLALLVNSAPQREGGASLKIASSSNKGASASFTTLTTFWRLRWEILALALPISWMAAVAARVASSSSSKHSSIADNGAMASRTYVWIFANSLSVALTCPEVSDFKKESSWGVLVAGTFGSLKGSRMPLRLELPSLFTQALVKSLLWLRAYRSPPRPPLDCHPKARNPSPQRGPWHTYHSPAQSLTPCQPKSATLLSWAYFWSSCLCSESGTLNWS